MIHQSCWLLLYSMLLLVSLCFNLVFIYHSGVTSFKAKIKKSIHLKAYGLSCCLQWYDIIVLDDLKLSDSISYCAAVLLIDYSFFVGIVLLIARLPFKFS